jgi:hypothetical protein
MPSWVIDLVWQLEGLLEREERPWFEARTLGENPVLLRQSLLRKSAIATRIIGLLPLAGSTHVQKRAASCIFAARMVTINNSVERIG